MKKFEDFGLSPALMSALQKMQYVKPTPIQAKAIAPALKGHDIMGSAQTGTGKTAAFAIPVVEMLGRDDQNGALILTPTRELAIQIAGVFNQLLGKKNAIKTALIIGGDAIGKQIAQLKNNPRIIIGTPGRINDHLERKTLKLNNTGLLVLDETDRMLDMGFTVQLDRIFKHLPKTRQTLMFSATLPDNILSLSNKYMNKPVRIAEGSTIKPAENIKQTIVRLDDDKKYPELVQQLENREGSVIVFVRTKRGSDRLAQRLSKAKFHAEPMHGDLKQSRRARVIRDYRNKKFRVLIATDVAARGLDIPHIEHVINYDLPQVPEDYIHRIGRTARAGAEGEAVCFVSPKEGRKWHAIEKLLNPDQKSEGGNGGNGDKPKSKGKNFKKKNKNRWSFTKKKKARVKAKQQAKRKKAAA